MIHAWKNTNQQIRTVCDDVNCIMLWDIGKLLVGTTPNMHMYTYTNDSVSPSIHTLTNHFLIRAWLIVDPFSSCGGTSVLILFRPCAGNHTCYGFLCATTMYV